MTFYQLALKYLRRKKGKTILMCLVLLFVSSMILATNMILRATQDAKSAIQEKTNSKIVLDILNNNSKITKEDVSQINHLKEVVSVNHLSVNTVFLSDFSPITNSDSTKEDNLKVSLLSYDDIENDSAFFEERYRLSAGQYITADNTNRIVINSLLAASNGLKIGDEMTFVTSDGKSVSAKIISYSWR